MAVKNISANVKKNSSHRLRFLRDGILRLGFYFLLATLSFVFLYPFIKMITQSLMTDDDLINITSALFHT